MVDKRSKAEEQKKKLTRMFPMLLGITFVIIVAVTVAIVAAKGSPKKNTPDSVVQTGESEVITVVDNQIVAVLKEINAEAQTMTFLNVTSGQDVILSYSGGTNLLDKYEQVIAVSQLTIGEMVDAYYSADSEKLVKLRISNLAWEYQGVNNWSIDRTKKVFEIVDSKYKYSQNIVVAYKDELSDLLSLDEKDELTIKGYEREIFSIQVTKGHGTLQLEDYKDFIGGTAYIGNDAILPIEADMLITIQEGTYEVTLENGRLTGTKQVVVGAGKDVIVNMGEFKKPVVQTGLVNFIIKPEGADLYIDDLLQTYETAMELEYGEHTIKVDLGGYTAYTGTIQVEESSKTLSIDLVETPDTTETEDTENSVDTGNDGTTVGNNNTEATVDNTDTVDTTGTDTENKIYIQKPEGASVYFSGEYKGTAPVNFKKKIGTFYITLIRTGYATKTYTVEVVDDGEDASFSFPDMVKTE